MFQCSDFFASAYILLILTNVQLAEGNSETMLYMRDCRPLRHRRVEPTALRNQRAFRDGRSPSPKLSVAFRPQSQALFQVAMKSQQRRELAWQPDSWNIAERET